MLSTPEPGDLQVGVGRVLLVSSPLTSLHNMPETAHFVPVGFPQVGADVALLEGPTLTSLYIPPGTL